jgi:hypothetical protein
VAVRGTGRCRRSWRSTHRSAPSPIDRDALDAIAELPQVVVDDAAHAQEHAIEVQLPFLQTVLGEFSLVPLAVGRAEPGDVEEVMERLWGGDETLIVISTDLSHYLPYAHARSVDAATIDRVLALDAGIGHHQACGATPLNGALAMAAQHGLQPRLLDLRNSGDTAGDRCARRRLCLARLHARRAGRDAGGRDRARPRPDEPRAKRDRLALGCRRRSKRRIRGSTHPGQRSSRCAGKASCAAASAASRRATIRSKSTCGATRGLPRSRIRASRRSRPTSGQVSKSRSR